VSSSAASGDPSQALPLLSALVHTHTYNQAGVWLRHAECLHTLQDLEAAAMSYSQVLSLAPHHTDTRLVLATIYVQLGRVEDALALLESEHYHHHGIAMETTEECSNKAEPGHEIQSPRQAEYTLEGLRVLLHKYTVLVTSGRVREYVADGVSLLTVLFKDVYHRKDLRSIMHLSAKTLMEKLGQKTPNLADSLLSQGEWWSLFFTTCKGLLKMGPVHHKQLLHLVLCAATLNTFELPEIELQYVLFAASLCYMMKEFALTFTFVKSVCMKFDQPVFWNILNALPLTSKYQKYLLRLCFKAPSHLTLLRIHANYSLATSNYKFALCLYDQSYRRLPDDYLTCLCMGSVYFSMASQKWATDRNQLVLQGMGFFHKYLRLRGQCQESMYNLGRAFQQIGVVHAACHFYRQVLLLEPENKDSKWCLASDLRPEAAFNLSLIYTASGNRVLAVQTLSQYCRI
jgi:general transcription factor 3C polypeptide 3 (transcription factor C subunit 4)